jgi:hypothetical protein
MNEQQDELIESQPSKNLWCSLNGDVTKMDAVMAALHRQPARPQAHRGGVRLDQDGSSSGEDPVPRSRPRWLRLHLRRRGLQSRPIAEAARGVQLMAKVPAFADRWRIAQDASLSDDARHQRSLHVPMTGRLT